MARCAGPEQLYKARGLIRTRRVTAGYTHSRHRAVIRGNQRTRRRRDLFQEEHWGHGRNWSDTLPRRFGTVRPRVQIPGPRPFLYSKSGIPGVVSRQVQVAGSQIFAELSKTGSSDSDPHLPSRASLKVIDRNRWPRLHSKPETHGPSREASRALMRAV